jgi:hypothetical protein
MPAVAPDPAGRACGSAEDLRRDGGSTRISPVGPTPAVVSMPRHIVRSAICEGGISLFHIWCSLRL